MSLNFKETGKTSGGTFDPLPEGRYNVQVEEATLTTASTGTEMIKSTFIVTEGEFKGRKLWNNFTLTQKSLVYLYNFMKAAGSTVIDQEDVDEAEVATSMKGLIVSAFVESTTTNTGNPTNKISKWAPPLEAGATGGAANLFS
ncbi:MAG: DUF669 domain-containing protein [Rhodobacteraceae bacterium]|nr:DUF669 domain-containing protein [Paracoccaceae bacterium]